MRTTIAISCLLACLIMANPAFADLTIYNQRNEPIGRCHTFGDVTRCEDLRPRLGRMVSGSRSDHLIGQELKVKENALAFFAVGTAFFFASIALEDQAYQKSIMMQLLDANAAKILWKGTRVEVLKTSDFYKSPLVQVKTTTGDECWVPVLALKWPE